MATLRVVQHLAEHRRIVHSTGCAEANFRRVRDWRRASDRLARTNEVVSDVAVHHIVTGPDPAVEVSSRCGLRPSEPGAVTGRRANAPMWSRWFIRLHGAPRRRDVRPGDSPTKSTRSTGHRLLSQPRGQQPAPQPMAGCVTKLGSALLWRTGADARIVSVVSTDGLE